MSNVIFVIGTSEPNTSIDESLHYVPADVNELYNMLHIARPSKVASFALSEYIFGIFYTLISVDLVNNKKHPVNCHACISLIDNISYTSIDSCLLANPTILNTAVDILVFVEKTRQVPFTNILSNCEDQSGNELKNLKRCLHHMLCDICQINPSYAAKPRIIHNVNIISLNDFIFHWKRQVERTAKSFTERTEQGNSSYIRALLRQLQLARYRLYETENVEEYAHIQSEINNLMDELDQYIDIREIEQIIPQEPRIGNPLHLIQFESVPDIAFYSPDGDKLKPLHRRFKHSTPEEVSKHNQEMIKAHAKFIDNPKWF